MVDPPLDLGNDRLGGTLDGGADLVDVTEPSS